MNIIGLSVNITVQNYKLNNKRHQLVYKVLYRPIRRILTLKFDSEIIDSAYFSFTLIYSYILMS